MDFEKGEITMALSRAQKMQMEAIKNPMAYYAQIYDDCTMIADGISGVYINSEETVIDTAKVNSCKNKKEELNQDKILADTIRMEKTKTAIILDERIAVKFIGVGGAVCWVDLALLKGYDSKEIAYYFNGSLKVIVFVKRDTEKPVGFCMTIRINEEE